MLQGNERRANLITTLKLKLTELSKAVRSIRSLSKAAAVDKVGKMILFVPALACTFVIALILAFLWYESSTIFASPQGGVAILVSPTWDPNRDLYGISVFIAGSFMCSLLAIGMAVPLGLGAAVFLSEYCTPKIRDMFKVVVEMMAAVPSIVYGLWAFAVMVPWIKGSLAPAVQNNPLTAWMPWFQGTTNGYSLLAGGLILAVMLLPTVVAVSDDALHSVPMSYREASYALGATKSETARRVVISAALPGIGAAVVLSLGRAVGETMAVLMVTGNSASIPYSLFDPCYVMTSVITNQLGYAFVYDLWRSALFAVALVLMLMSVCFTIIAKLAIRHGMKTRGLV
ncbi:MAG: phosphate ABC transporter permease subunit PstC [Candidatus Thorarchaeota archaeon]|nr:phosphate ABC transporter permease subunit PstC [Candidatus Thorarchaeota archaeon]